MIRRFVYNDNPFSEIERMIGQTGRREGVGFLPVDIYEKEGSLFISASVPGMKVEDLSVSVHENVLTLKAESKSEWQEEDAKVYRSENRYGSFTRSIRLGEDVDLAGAEAEFSNGFLTVRIRKVEPQKPEPLQIPIKSAVAA